MSPSKATSKLDWKERGLGADPGISAQMEGAFPHVHAKVWFNLQLFSDSEAVFFVSNMTILGNEELVNFIVW